MPKSILAAFSSNLISSDWRNTNLEDYSLSVVRVEFLAGLTVALALIPEAVAFAFVAGVHPLSGLYAAFIVGLITALFGGRPGMISGATGALAVVMVSLVAEHGVDYLFATVILMGILQVLAGIFRLGKFIRLVPHPVMLGFVNGLAIVIFLAQLSHFETPDQSGLPGSGNDQILAEAGIWMTGMPLALMVGLVAITMAAIWLVPKLTKVIPAPLAGIVLVTAIVVGFGLDAPRVGDMASIEGNLPTIYLPAVPLTFETLRIIFPYALILAAIGLIESLLTLNLVGEITGKRGGASKECLAQGGANFVTGFFGGMGGCAMIGQSMINIKSGGRTRLSGIFAAMLLLGFILFASSLIEQIPLAALVGVMFMVVIGTFAWRSLTIMRHIPIVDALVIVLVTVVTVMYDLAIAVVVGVTVSALAYAWNNASRIHADIRMSGTKSDARKIYEIDGPLFFGSASGFALLFKPEEDPSEVIIDFMRSRVVDQSALQAIEDVAAKYQEHGKMVWLRHLTPDCHRLLNRTGQIVIDADNDPDYGLAVDYSVQLGVLSGKGN